MSKTEISNKKVSVSFDALSIEGGLFSPEWLAKIAHRQAEYQNEASYCIPKGLNLRDEVSRYFRIALGLWGDFKIHLDSEKFIKDLLSSCFGFDDIQEHSEPFLVGGRQFPIKFSASNKLFPIVIANKEDGLNTSSIIFHYEGRKRTAFGLTQEFLNASKDALWGLCTDGYSLRVLRDNSSLTKPAWFEADLRSIFDGNIYSEFATLWLLVHRTRFGLQSELSTGFIIEKWRNRSRSEGVRAQEKLRAGVERSLEVLGQGFLINSSNVLLQRSLSDGSLSLDQYYHELLRLVYKFIFLLTIEERELLHPAITKEDVRQLYRDGFSLRRLRDRAIKKKIYDSYNDLWESFLITAKGLQHGEPRLGLPPLGGLFSKAQTPHLDVSVIDNKFLLSAIFSLSWISEEAGVTKVNWRDMGPEELGSVYEGLLELVPQVRENGRVFTFIKGEESKGNARKLTGSYYTPDSLVQSLLDSALEPVILQTIKDNPSDPVEALLKLSIIDPSCGSGHFLLGAVRRLASHVAKLQVEGIPSTDDFRKALRLCVGRCIYGVDKNPLALELARTALWLESMTPDAPLNFLDHHLICGDSLLGLISFDKMKGGIPGDAFKAMAGDDKEICKTLSMSNRKALSLFDEDKVRQLSFQLVDKSINSRLEDVEKMPDATPVEIEKKKIAIENIKAMFSSGTNFNPLVLAADLYVGAFLSPKTAANVELVPTSDDVHKVLGGALVSFEKIHYVQTLLKERGVFHWPNVFPQVFSKGGFDVIVGNPPWDVQQLNEEEFFSSRDPEIARLQGDERKRAIKELENKNPRLWNSFNSEVFKSASANVFFRKSGRYPLTATGKINTYPLFSETCLSIKSVKGRVGIIVPTGIATDDSTSTFFGSISNGQLVSLIDFENKEGLFPGVHRSYKFSLMTLGNSQIANFMFYLTKIEDIQDNRRKFSLTSEEISTLNPNSKTVAIFRSLKDADLVKKIYSRTGVFWNETAENGNAWNVEFRQGLLNMTSDSHYFKTAETKDQLKDPVSLYEAKMVNFYDHRYGSYGARSGERGFRVLPETTLTEYQNVDFEITPYYWVERSVVNGKVPTFWKHNWLMGWKDVTAATNERTVIPCIIPNTAVGHTYPLLFSPHGINYLCCLLSNLSSLVLDYVARTKVGGLHLTYTYLKQLPILKPEQYSEVDLEFITSRVCELTYTSNSLHAFGEELGFSRPFKWVDSRRLILKAELDAYFAALYGLSRSDLQFILDPSKVMGDDYPSETFRILKESETRLYKNYKTEQLVLEAWDRLEIDGRLPGARG